MSTLNSIMTLLYEAASEQDFWNFVRWAKWNSDFDYDRIKMQMMRKYTEQEVAALQDTYQTLKKRLDARITDVVSGVGDDSYSDLLAHIIGSGEKVYKETMENPGLAQKRVDGGYGDADSYVESFSYVFPYKSDWKMKSEQYWINQGSDMLRRLNLPDVRQGIETEDEAEIYKDLVRRFRLMSQGNFEKAVRGYDPFDSQAYNRTSLSRHPEIMYGPPNWLNDLKQYMLTDY